MECVDKGDVQMTLKTGDCMPLTTERSQEEEELGTFQKWPMGVELRKPEFKFLYLRFLWAFRENLYHTSFPKLALETSPILLPKHFTGHRVETNQQIRPVGKEQATCLDFVTLKNISPVLQQRNISQEAPRPGHWILEPKAVCVCPFLKTAIPSPISSCLLFVASGKCSINFEKKLSVNFAWRVLMPEGLGKFEFF